MCSKGNYGNDCLEVCACKSDKFVCNATLGCMCRDGFTGDDCNTPKIVALENFMTEIAEKCLIWTATVLLILVGILLFILMYYRRQNRNFSTTLAKVEYHARPQMFENPGYSILEDGPINNIPTAPNKVLRSQNVYTKYKGILDVV